MSGISPSFMLSMIGRFDVVVSFFSFLLLAFQQGSGWVEMEASKA